KRKDFNDSLKSAEIYSEINNLSASQKLKIVTISYLIYSLAYGKVNFEFVSPLISRIESRSESIEKTIEITDETVEKGYLTVINLKKCNSEAKKMIPLLIAKQLYEEHKVKNDKFEIKTTIHLIIDEAHNILSTQSAREAEGWKDYRLETFEEIIKEGRKFGFYLTLASQRPSDISPTIMSQLHNYFIHRLVNEQDLRMIENTVSSLDEASRKQIPSLAPGQCIITGTSYSMPLLIKVEKLGNDISPTSESANLVKLWTGKG
ncbi:ATP-binding protein, partial [Staphylococcus pseudintermedius]|nr:ATP-binding protein [Staphylococcus pseudintermedius]